MTSPASSVVRSLPAQGDHALARLLVEAGHLTEDQLRHAEKVRSKLRQAHSLTTVLIDLGLVDEPAVLSVLRESTPDIPLGTLLIELGYLDEAELGTALAQQKHNVEEGRLGEILLRRHLVKEADLLKVLAAKLGLDAVSLSITDVAPELLERLPTASCLKGGFFPLRREGERLYVAFANPDSAHARAVAQSVFEGFELCPALAARSDIDACVAALERARRNAGSAARESEAGSESHTVTRLVDDIIALGTDQSASDIHIEPLRDRVRVRVRCDGVLRELMDFGKDQLAPVSARLKVLASANVAERRRHQDGRLLYTHPRTGEQLDLRASFFVTVNGESTVLRLLNRKRAVIGLRELGLSPAVLAHLRDEALDTPSGIIVITGPTGSGKTTSLYSCVHHLNNESISIITAEDPVEYQIEGINQCSINPKLDLTFDETLRHIVRQDPDIIVLGEIRDEFSAATAIQAALTGHKVLTTFHTEDAVGALLRLLNMHVEPFLLASSVSAILSQRLLRRVCENCAVPVIPDPRLLRLLDWMGERSDGGNYRRGRGCAQCHFTGYEGRIAVFELLVPNEPVRDAVMRVGTFGELRAVCMAHASMVTLLEDGLIKAAKGLTTIDEVLRHLPRLTRPRALGELRRLTGSY